MPEYLAPGVYIEEVEIGAKPIEGVSTSTVGFLGETERGPTEPKLVTSWNQYQRIFGSYFGKDKYLPYAIQGFFTNGGKRCYIARIDYSREKAYKDIQVGLNEPFKIKAIGEGCWGEYIHVEFSKATINDFKLSIYYKNDKLPVEIFDNLSFSEDSEDFYQKQINDISNFVYLESIPEATGNGKIIIPPEITYTENIEILYSDYMILNNGCENDVSNSSAEIILGKGKYFKEISEYNSTDNKATFESCSDRDCEIKFKITKNILGTIEKIDLKDSEGSYEISFDDMNYFSNSTFKLEGETNLLDIKSSKTAPKNYVFQSEIAYNVGDKLNIEQEINSNVIELKKDSLKLNVKKEEYSNLEKSKIKIIINNVEISNEIKDKSNDDNNFTLEDKIYPFESKIFYKPKLSKDNESNIKRLEPNLKDFIGEGFDKPNLRGLNALSEIDGISIVYSPHTDIPGLSETLVNHCEDLKDRFAIIDNEQKSNDIKLAIKSEKGYAAFYHPWVKVVDPQDGVLTKIPPGGHVAGVYARSDIERGVFKAPANEILRGVSDLALNVTTGEQDILNPKGINAIRSLPGRGIRIWGARTLATDPLWKYVNIRRLFIFLEKSIEENTQWVVFEPNNERLWDRVIQTITQFLTQVWKDGALMGNTPEEGFFVKCDRTTMTQNDIDNGRLIVMIGVAPTKPAEFVVFRIAQWTAGA